MPTLNKYVCKYLPIYLTLFSYLFKYLNKYLIYQTSPPHDPRSEEEIRVSASMKENDHTEEMNGMNFDNKDYKSEETSDIDDTEMDTVTTAPQADKLLGFQKKITFPQHLAIAKDDETELNDAPSAMTDDSDADAEPKIDKEDPLILPDPVIVHRYDFSPRSVQEFLLSYPDNRENRSSTINLLFFNNEIRFQPNGTFIQNFHEFAYGKYRLLEQHHGYPLLEQDLIIDTFNGFFQLESKD